MNMRAPAFRPVVGTWVNLPPAAWTLVAPAFVLSFVFFVVPMIGVLVNSFTTPTAGGLQATIQTYAEILTDSFYWEVLARTLRISLFTTIVCLLISLPAALHLYFSRPFWRRVFLLIVISPLFVSVIVRTYGWIILLSPNGAINAVTPDAIHFRMLQTEGAIVAGLVHLYVPFMLLSINATMSKIDRRLLTAAATLGATPFQIFRDVLLRLSIPGIMAGCIVVFSISMTAFSTPVLLGGIRNKTMPYLIYQQTLLLSNPHLAAALAYVLLAFTLVIAYALNRTSRSSTAEMAAQ